MSESCCSGRLWPHCRSSWKWDGVINSSPFSILSLFWFLFYVQKTGDLHREPPLHHGLYRALWLHGRDRKNNVSGDDNEVRWWWSWSVWGAGLCARVKEASFTHPVSRSHMLVKQIHILCTASQHMLRGRPEHVLHDLRSGPSLIIKALLGDCAQGQLEKSQKLCVGKPQKKTLFVLL